MRQKGFAHLILIIAVILLAMGALGYLAYQNAQLTNIADLSTPTTATPTPLTNESPTQKVENNTWLIYTHPEWGYSFDYPNNWKVEIAGYSRDEPNGFPYVSKKDGSYEWITFEYTKTDEMSLTGSDRVTINDLDTYIFEGAFGGDNISNVYVFKISDDEYITARYPIDDPNIPIEPGSDDVIAAEKIISTFRLTP